MDKKQTWFEKLEELLADRAAIVAGLDVHSAMAAWHYNKPIGDVTPEERNYAKMVSFGYLYSNTWRDKCQPRKR